jgi:hypothetical protein
MTKNKAKNEGMGTLLGYLDEKLNSYYQKNNLWPGKIIMSKEAKDKIFAELDLTGIKDNNSWYDTKDNYRGISIEIKDIDFLKLE